jgi:hypothetical protein
MYNFRREVSLADAIKKPIIPLKLDTAMKWPPEGPMSMAFSQMVYINFCKPNEDIQNDWSCPHFDELKDKIAEYLDVSFSKHTETNSEAPTSHQPSPPPPPLSPVSKDIVIKIIYTHIGLLYRRL